jgi:hypothetical protein
VGLVDAMVSLSLRKQVGRARVLGDGGRTGDSGKVVVDVVRDVRSLRGHVVSQVSPRSAPEAGAAGVAHAAALHGGAELGRSTQVDCLFISDTAHLAHFLPTLRPAPYTYQK